VPREIKKDRRHRMNELLKQISLNNNQADIGTNRLVMINKIDHDRVA
jgi:tRNA A37 methylthiotransferase MiaB